MLCAPACLPSDFDALAEAAPVRTVQVRFPAEPNAALAIALTVPGSSDADGRGWVLFGDGDSALGWSRLHADGRVDLRYATFEELTSLGGGDQPQLTGLALSNADTNMLEAAEGLVRVADTSDRIVRFGLADFTRVGAIQDDLQVYPWVGAAPTLTGALAAVELDADAGLPEVLSAGADGLFIWDSLGTTAQGYAQARAQLLADDPAAFDADPVQGWGLTWCPQLHPSALAGGRVSPGQERAALALDGQTLSFVGRADPLQVSAVGAPIYDCARASLSLPGPASTLAVVDLGLDDDDDLLVGSPSSAAVWVYENQGDGVPAAPSMVLELPDDDDDDPQQARFGASLAAVALGDTSEGEDALQVIVVGAPGSRVDGKADVGRVFVFDASDGALLRSIEHLAPRSGSAHGLAVHGVDLAGRQELVVTGARELRVHWVIMAQDVGPTSAE